MRWFLDSDVSKRAQKAEEKAKTVIEDPAAVDQIAEKAQAKVRRSGGKIAAVKRELEILIRLLRAWAGGKYKGVSIVNLVIIVGAVAYFVNPIDAIADFLPLIGFSDDVAVIAFAISRIRGEFDKFEEWEKNIDIS